MTNKKFQKLIRKNYEYSSYRIGNTIEKIFRKNSTPKNKIIRKIIGSKTNAELLEENLDEIIEIANKNKTNNLFESYEKERNIFSIYSDLSRAYPELVPILEKNIMKFVKVAPYCFHGSSLRDFFKKEENTNFVKENLEEFILAFKGSVLEEEKYLEKTLHIEIPKDLKNKVFEVNKKEIYKEFFSHIDYKTSNEDIELYSYSIDNIITELLEREKCEYSDIEIIGSGTYYKVLKIGEKVFKIGIPRRKHDFPNHKRILQPIIRTNMETKDGKAIGCIEVSEYVNAFKGKEEEMKKIFDELAQDGIIYGDMKRENLGILKKSNKNNYTDIEVAPESIGTDKNNDETLEEGEVVIIDTDHIYNKDDKKLYNASKLSRQFYEDLKKQVNENTDEIDNEKNDENNKIKNQIEKDDELEK